MYLLRLVLIALVGVVFGRAGCGARHTPWCPHISNREHAPRLMVANPFAFAPADSATAVRIGSCGPKEMKDIAGRNFNVVEQSQMNDALKQYGYPVDAILSPPAGHDAGQEHSGPRAR